MNDTTRIPDPHRYIELDKYHRSQQNSEEYVRALIREMQDGGWRMTLRDGVYVIHSEPKETHFNLRETIETIRSTGTSSVLRGLANSSDPMFPIEIEMAASGEGPNFTFKVVGQELTLRAPGCIGLVEVELTNDILEHRRQVSQHSTKDSDYRVAGMHIRAYTLCCCALVEAFLNRAVYVATTRNSISPRLAELQFPGRIDERLELWLAEFCNCSLDAINHGVEWAHYIELKDLRNTLVHPTESLLGVNLKDAERQLNLVRHGVGGLVNKLRALQGYRPLPFAERLATAPQARFRSEIPRGARRANART